MRLIDADALLDLIKDKDAEPRFGYLDAEDIANTPTIELSGDLISRHDVIERLEDFCGWCKDNRLKGAKFTLDCVIPNIPSAYRPTGEWMPINYFGIDALTCSNCEYVIGKLGRPYNYCPNCGARMVTKDE